MSDYGYNYNQHQFDRAQRQYDNQMPPDDNECLRDCDQCGEEYEVEIDDDGDFVHTICEKCRKSNESESEWPQT